MLCSGAFVAGSGSSLSKASTQPIGFKRLMHGFAGPTDCFGDAIEPQTIKGVGILAVRWRTLTKRMTGQTSETTT